MLSIIGLVVLAWVLFSVPFAVLIGRGIRVGEPVPTAHNPARATRELPEQLRVGIAA